MRSTEVEALLLPALVSYTTREDQLHNAVQNARDLGATWTQIADSLGVSRQAVHARFA